jgi:hypothetical protein
MNISRQGSSPTISMLSRVRCSQAPRLRRNRMAPLSGRDEDPGPLRSPRSRWRERLRWRAFLKAPPCASSAPWPREERRSRADRSATCAQQSKARRRSRDPPRRQTYTSPDGIALLDSARLGSGWCAQCACGMHRSSYSAMTISPASGPQAGHAGSRRTLNVRNDSSSASYASSRPIRGSPSPRRTLMVSTA